MVCRQILIIALVLAGCVRGASAGQLVRVKDITRPSGARQNQLMGYGLVVGLDNTGDTQQTKFTTQMIANLLQRFNITVPAREIRVGNAAAVILVANLPPFVKSGDRIDVTVSSLGNASSLQGGILLQTPMRGADGYTYAAAQGPVSIGGFSSEGAGAKVTKNHPTVGRIPGGAIVEAEVPMHLVDFGILSLSLNYPDFVTATRIAEVINARLGSPLASARDEATVDITVPEAYLNRIPELVSVIGNLMVEPDFIAKVVVNERTGTIVVGGSVKITPVAVAHQGLSVRITTDYAISQPAPLSDGETVVVPRGTVETEEPEASLTEIGGGTIEELVKCLNAIRVTPKDMVAILQAVKQAGALQAELDVL
ncbi:MAG: flagellar basal body P-ring protein FlgI [Armatimonadetes bacterium]|nr:flagellar basal body P-ring protein FlgI [Armatimonadota bacterium]NIM24360.1 flagellar basal body P-ring protein FlgI [Armatimonadota bacterium]NIM68229.1 flagellar basal body P-ring protein FlgI [Armatimonadota bacterium]NIM75130.1 flagellar basal body P-ring protein FlgI [Armatimonadota bacterium]NIN06434.1 flagellar basal body P-ring protein FlgI [Armatimonadota bacterium]